MRGPNRQLARTNLRIIGTALQHGLPDIELSPIEMFCPQLSGIFPIGPVYPDLESPTHVVFLFGSFRIRNARAQISVQTNPIHYVFVLVCRNQNLFLVAASILRARPKRCRSQGPMKSAPDGKIGKPFEASGEVSAAYSSQFYPISTVYSGLQYDRAEKVDCSIIYESHMHRFWSESPRRVHFDGRRMINMISQFHKLYVPSDLPGKSRSPS